MPKLTSSVLELLLKKPMFQNESLKKKLLFTYLIVGILNVLVIFFFSIYIYRAARSTLLERVQAQMISTRSMTSAKLVLYFQNLKMKLAELSEEMAQGRMVQAYDSSVTALWVTNKINEQLYGVSAIRPQDQSLETNIFHPYKDGYLLKIIENKHTFLWFLNNTGASNLFSEREGLGESGEIYLVGKDYKIKSASRHLKDWSNTVVQNNSVTKAFHKIQGVEIVEDYRGVEVLSAYSYFEFDKLSYALLSEIDMDEVLYPLKNLLIIIYLLSLLLFITNLFYSLKFAKNIHRTVTRQRKEIEDLHFSKEKSEKENALKIFRVQENERERISFSLHDSVGQYLTVLKWGLARLKSEEKDEGKLKELKLLSQTCDDTIHDIRTISHDLMPTLIRDFGVCSAIKDYLDKQSHVVNLRLKFDCLPRLKEQKFKKDFEVNLYRMVQEFFQNNIKHSKAQSLQVELTLSTDKFILIYQDDGIGIPKDAPLPYSIYYRARLFGGIVENIPTEHGLRIEVTFNLSEIQE